MEEHELNRLEGEVYRLEAPPDAEDVMIYEMLERIQEGNDTDPFYSSIGSYIIGKMENLGVIITMSNILKFAPRLAEPIKEYMVWEYVEEFSDEFFQEAIDSAIDEGYAWADLTLTKKGKEMFTELIAKEAMYN